MKQKRWFCHTCQREWLDNKNAAGVDPPWTSKDGCPGCRSAQIREIEYQAPFPGGDIPRADVIVAEATEASTVPTQPPPLALVAAPPPPDLWQLI